MKKLAIAAVLFSGLAFGQTKKIVSSAVHWWGYKIAKSEVSSHNGSVKLKSGNITLKNNQIVGGNFVLDMNSINAEDLSGESQQKLNGHLKTGDFFETEKFPAATYNITSVKKNADKNFPYMVNGNLTVKNKTAPVSFPAKIGMSKGALTLQSDKFSVDRQKFDVTYKAAMQDVLVKDDMDFTVKFTAK